HALRSLVQLLAQRFRIGDLSDQRNEETQVAFLFGRELDITRQLGAHAELRVLRRPPFQPDAREVDATPQLFALRRSERRALALLRLAIRFDAWDLQPVRDDAEANAKPWWAMGLVDLRQRPRLRRVALGRGLVGLAAAVVLVPELRQVVASRVEIDVALWVRPQHEEADEVRRVDLHELVRRGTELLPVVGARGRHLPAAHVQELVNQPDRRLFLPHFAIHLVRAIARAARRQEVLAAFLVRDVEVVPHRAPLDVPVQLRATFEG